MGRLKEFLMLRDEMTEAKALEEISYCRIEFFDRLKYGISTDNILLEFFDIELNFIDDLY